MLWSDMKQGCGIWSAGWKRVRVSVLNSVRRSYWEDIFEQDRKGWRKKPKGFLRGDVSKQKQQQGQWGWKRRVPACYRKQQGDKENYSWENEGRASGHSNDHGFNSEWDGKLWTVQRCGVTSLPVNIASGFWVWYGKEQR